MVLTKNDKARVIIQALYNMPELPAADHQRVKKQARATMPHLDWLYEKAVEVLQQRLARKEPKQ